MGASNFRVADESLAALWPAISEDIERVDRRLRPPPTELPPMRQRPPRSRRPPEYADLDELAALQPGGATIIRRYGAQDVLEKVRAVVPGAQFRTAQKGTDALIVERTA